MENKPKREEGEGGEEVVEEDQKLLENNWEQFVPTFEEMKLKKDLLRGIFGVGFEKPSAI